MCISSSSSSSATLTLMPLTDSLFRSANRAGLADLFLSRSFLSPASFSRLSLPSLAVPAAAWLLLRLSTPTPSIAVNAACPPAATPPARTIAFHRSFTSISALLYAKPSSSTLRFNSPFSRSSCSMRARSGRVVSAGKSRDSAADEAEPIEMDGGGEANSDEAEEAAEEAAEEDEVGPKDDGNTLGCCLILAVSGSIEERCGGC